MENEEKKKIIQIAVNAGEIMLSNGAETYRVEDTINRICHVKNLNKVSSFATLSGIFVSDNESDGINIIRRIRHRTIDLNKVALVNDFSRTFTKENIDNELSKAVLKSITSSTKYSDLSRIFYAGLASGSFCILFKGNYFDFFAAFIISMFSMKVQSYFDDLSETPFLSIIASSMVIALMAISFSKFGFGNDIDKTIIGAIMPLLPGVALTNGIRDLISGDLISGSSRMIEAILVAISIAVGIASIITLWLNFFGGIL